jgi:hypothetical protein
MFVGSEAGKMVALREIVQKVCKYIVPYAGSEVKMLLLCEFAVIYSLMMESRGTAGRWC